MFTHPSTNRHLPKSLLFISMCCSLLFCPPALGQKKQPDKRKVPPVFQPPQVNPNLPHVLIIGDSISMGYTLPARAALKNSANLWRPPTNCGPTTRGLEQIDKWLGDRKWDVIHFNFGLHDLKYIDDKGRLVPVDKGHQQVPIEKYTENLEKLILRLKKTNAKLIWRNTTPVPEGSRGRITGDEVKYNKAAKKLMLKHKIQIHDLYTFALKKQSEIQRKKDVHYTPKGSKVLAEEVARVITMALQPDKKED